MGYRDQLSDYVQDMIKASNYDSRLVNQFASSEDEYKDTLNVIEDIANDRTINQIKGLYHRYPTKVLIFPTERCMGSCRFCFRKNIIEDTDLNGDDYDLIVEYLKSKPKISEVIFSGGDPFAYELQKLVVMINRIMSINTIKIVRIHTRILTYNPYLITKGFINAIQKEKPLYMVFHINSHLELTDVAKEKVKMLTSNGIYCFSQSALLKGVNDTKKDLEALFTSLIFNKIKPYYLFHPDRAKGTGHFYVPLEKGIKLYNSLYNYISGLAMPKYLFNIPSGYGHCIVDLGNIALKKRNIYSIRSWENKTVEYEDIE